MQFAQQPCRESSRSSLGRMACTLPNAFQFLERCSARTGISSYEKSGSTFRQSNWRCIDRASTQQRDHKSKTLVSAKEIAFATAAFDSKEEELSADELRRKLVKAAALIQGAKSLVPYDPGNFNLPLAIW